MTAKDWLESGLHRDIEDYDGRIADYTEAIRLDPQYADAYYHRGIARMDKRDLEGAIADYTEAIRLNPQHADAYDQRSTVYYMEGDLDDALSDCNQAVQIEPNAFHYYGRAFIYRIKGNLDCAIRDYNAAIQAEPKIDEPYYDLGLIWQEKGELAQANAYFQQYIDNGGLFVNRATEQIQANEAEIQKRK